MKKIFILIYLGCIHLINAQVTVNQHPEVWSKFAVNYMNYSNVEFSKQIRPTGGNQNWDFTNLKEVLYSDTIKYIDPVDFPLAAPVPGANLLVQDESNAISNLMYYNVTNTEQKAVGLFVDTNETVKFDRAFLTNKFPLQENNEFEDMTTFNINLQGFGKIRAEVLNFNVVDGWGEIITPTSTYQCLRMKTSTIVEGSVAGIPILNSTIIEYRWMSPSYQYDVFKYIVFEQEFDTITVNDTIIIDLNKQITGITNLINKEEIELVVSPNPSKDLIKIIIPESFTEQTKIEIFNEQALISYSQDLSSKLHEVNVSQWPRGAYLIKVNDKNNRWTLKKIILE